MLLEEVGVVVGLLPSVILRPLFRHLGQAFQREPAVWGLNLVAQAGVAELPKQVAGVELAFAGAVGEDGLALFGGPVPVRAAEALGFCGAKWAMPKPAAPARPLTVWPRTLASWRAGRSVLAHTLTHRRRAP